MSNLNITADMIIELAESRAEHVGIVLTDTGWEIQNHPDGLPPMLTALTALEVRDVAEIEDDEPLDRELAAQLAAGGPYGGYQISTQGRGHATADWQVVTPEAPDEPAWGDAWAFDLTAAEQIVDEPAGQLRNENKTSALWLTEDGTWVVHQRSLYQGDGPAWHEITPAEAARYVYTADPDDVTDTPQPLVRAAVAARALIDALEPPEIPFENDPGLRAGKAWRRVPAATEVFHATTAIADLVRLTVQSQIRDHKVAAAQLVNLAHDTQQEAADHLGIKQPRLNELLRP